MQRISSGTFLVVCAIALVGCGSNGASAPTTTAPVTAPALVPTESDVTVAGSSGDAAAGDEPAVVEHALGAVDVVADPARVVALDRSLIDAALALELPLAGYTTYNEPNGGLPDYFGDALAYAAGATWVGDLLDPNIEAIAALDPDLILMTAVRHEDLYDEFSAIAPTVATESAGGGWKDNIRLIAAATGRTQLGDQVLADYEQRAAEVGAAVNAVADEPTISVVRFADAIRLYQPVSFSGVVLEDAGLARPESQQDRDDFIAIISEEELGLADADVLIYTIAAHDAVEKMAGEVQERPLWQSLSAVQTGNAHPVLDDSWMSGVGVFGAHLILDDLETIFGVG
ncbi:MAG: iron-siderophore ABC transporter substrate-binding protein [Ilumatobacter sp.]|nr:iron-siderophore ABC transporter substrate-binding protein [Ilumatobacter sp.]